MKLKDFSDNSIFRLPANTISAHIHMNHKTNKLAKDIQERIYKTDERTPLFGYDMQLNKKEMIAVFGKDFEIHS